MKQSDLLKLVQMCSANYRNWPEKGKEEDVISLWNILFSDVDFSLLRAAVQKHMMESTYPPTIADIREQIAKIALNEQKTGIEAWGDVKNAIRRFGYYESEKGISSLKGLTKKVVELMGYRELCQSENEMADRAHFLKVYDSLVAREKEQIKVPLVTSGVGRTMIEGGSE